MTIYTVTQSATQGFFVKDPKLKLRGKVWQYRSRVPERLKDLFASNGNDPDKRIAISLLTTDPAIALFRKRLVESWLESGGVGIIDFVSPRQHYLEQSTLLGKQPIDEIYGIRDPIIDPSIIDGLQQGHTDPRMLTQQQWAAIYATLADVTGKPPPTKYMYSLRDALLGYKALRKGEIRDKTLAAYDRAVELYLDGKPDVSLDAIKSAEVALWLDGLKAKTAKATRVDHLARLIKLFTYARGREYCLDRRNPFEDHDLGMADAKAVQPMSDSELLNILPKLSSDSDRAWAVLARHTGMRLAEICHATIVVDDGVVCFSVREIEEAEWTPKTTASTRLVPIRKSLIPYARKYQPKLKNPKDFTKRFGNVKKKLYPDRNRILVFHSLRHSFVTMAYQAGYSELQVSFVSGHVSTRGTGESAKTYHHGYSVGLLSEIVEAIPALEGFD
jgi:integrase